MDKIEISVEVLANLLSKSKEEVINLTKKEDGTAFEPNEINASIKSIAADKFKKIEKESADKAVKNSLDKREKELSKAFEISDFSDYSDLVSQIQAKKGEGTASPELQKQVDTYKKKYSDLETKLQNVVAENEKKHNEYESKALFNEAMNTAKNHVKTLGLKLPSDAAIEKLVKAEMLGKTIKKIGGKLRFVDENGDEEKDDMHKPIELEGFFTAAFSEFGKADATPSGSGSGNPPKGAGKFNFTKEELDPKNYLKTYEAIGTADKERQAAFNKAYETQFD